MRYPFEDKFDVKYDEKALEEYSKQVNEFTVNYLSQDLIIKKQEQEIDRLSNIINELEKYINDDKNWFLELGYKSYEPYIEVKMILDKLKELKGEENE